MRELETEEVALVSGGFWEELLQGITDLLRSGSETSIPANNGELGIRG